MLWVWMALAFYAGGCLDPIESGLRSSATGAER